MAREARAGRCTLPLKAAGAPIPLHVHCHRKACGAVGPILDVLKMIRVRSPN